MGWFYVITQEIRESFEGKEADVFAVINGFSQEGQGCFYGSLSLLSQFCGIRSKTTTQRILKSLVAKGAIVKTDELHNGVKFCSYKVNKNWYTIPKIDMGGISNIDTNKKEDININNDSLYKKGSIRFHTLEFLMSLPAYAWSIGAMTDCLSDSLSCSSFFCLASWEILCPSPLTYSMMTL